MKYLLMLCTWACCSYAAGQPPTQQPLLNLRLSLLLFPTTPLLTVEVRTVGNWTIQGETNFAHTHGLNLKYFVRSPMEGPYGFVGTAFVRHQLLRQDGAAAVLAYAGVGHAQRLGRSDRWIIDHRIGIGPTLNADEVGVYPILKTGIGRLF